MSACAPWLFCTECDAIGADRRKIGLGRSEEQAVGHLQDLCHQGKMLIILESAPPKRMITFFVLATLSLQGDGLFDGLDWLVASLREGK